MNAYTEYLGSYGIQSQAYAWASCAPEHQIAPCPLSEGSSSRKGARGRDRHLTSQPKDSGVRWRKVQAVKRWACAMVSSKFLDSLCQRASIASIGKELLKQENLPTSCFIIGILPLESWMFTGWITVVIGSSSVSTTICSILPLIFLPGQPHQNIRV